MSTISEGHGPGERQVGDHVRRLPQRQTRALERENLEFCRAIPEDLDMAPVPDVPTLEDPYEEAQALVTRIVAVSAAIALAFLAGAVFCKL